MADNLTRFLYEIGYDSDKKHTNINGLKILVDWDNDIKEKPFLDEDYYTRSGEFMICMNSTERTIKELLFDFYHEVGKIMLKVGGINVEEPTAWLKKNQYKVSNKSNIVQEMACDIYAGERLDYNVTLTKVLPLVRLDKYKASHKGIDNEAAKEEVICLNEDIKVRRKYLNLKISEANSIKLHDMLNRSSTAPTKPLASLDNYNPEKARKSRANKNTEILVALAESFGIDTGRTFDDKGNVIDKPVKQTTMQEILFKIGITYSSNEDWSCLCNRLIRAITSPHIDQSLWYNISEVKYVSVYNEPEDWNTNYHNYYRKDPKGIYIHIGGYTAPSFSDFAVYRKKNNNNTKEIISRKEKYGYVVRNFVVPYYKKYCGAFRANERNNIAYAITCGLDSYISTGLIPTEEDVNKYIAIYTRRNDIEKSVRSGAAGKMSYNERIKMMKSNEAKNDGESDTEYDARIKRLVMAQMEEERKQMEEDRKKLGIYAP